MWSAFQKCLFTAVLNSVTRKGMEEFDLIQAEILSQPVMGMGNGAERMAFEGTFFDSHHHQRHLHCHAEEDQQQMWSPNLRLRRNSKVRRQI